MPPSRNSQESLSPYPTLDMGDDREPDEGEMMEREMTQQLLALKMRLSNLIRS